jgi:hypothetical protein
MADTSAPPEGTFVALLVKHQGPQFIDGAGTVECFCGEAVDTDLGWARHVHQMLMDANMAVVSLEGLLRICTTVAVQGDA